MTALSTYTLTLKKNYCKSNNNNVTIHRLSVWLDQAIRFHPHHKLCLHWQGTVGRIASCDESTPARKLLQYDHRPAPWPEWGANGHRAAGRIPSTAMLKKISSIGFSKGEGIRLQIQGAHGTNSGPEQPDGMRHCPKQQCTASGPLGLMLWQSRAICEEMQVLDLHYRVPDLHGGGGPHFV